jgi:hypothetical protein
MRIILVILIISTLGFGNEVLQKKVISEGKIDCSDIMMLDIFPTTDGNASVLIKGKGMTDGFLYMQNNLRTIDKSGLINGFIENDQVMLVFYEFHKESRRIKTILLYDAQKGLAEPIKAIEITKKMQDAFPLRILAVPQMPGKCYIFCSEEKFMGISAFTRYLCGGYAYGRVKPYLAEVEKGRISKYKEIRYGGEKNEDFHVKEVTGDGNMIRCLGFRGQDESGQPSPPLGSPYVLYYAGYDLKKKTVTQKHNVYEINYDGGSYNFGPLSIAGQDDGAFIAFSFYRRPFRGAPFKNLKQIKSEIYYFQSSDKSTDKAVQIAEGFMPIVKCDSAGKVCVLWVDYNGNIVCKTKRGDEWAPAKIIATGIDMYPAAYFRRYISAEFDSRDNLHLVFPSNGNLLYAKVKLDSIFEKQD